MLPILDIIHADKTRYVTRSVANHLNDVSKFAPVAVIEKLKSWEKLGKQNEQELSFITKHALRTLIKDGNTNALELLGYKPAKVITTLILTNTKIKVGESIEFSLKLVNQEKSVTNLLVHYVIYFKKANETLSPKVFLAKKLKLKPAESVTFKKSHSLKPMTTRALYTGEHCLEIRVNGVKIAEEKFLLE